MHADTRRNSSALPFHFNVNHGLTPVDKLAKQPSRIFTIITRYSVNNTLPIAVANAWLQFSLSYIAAIVITNNDLSFITAVFNPKLMSIYALVSVVLGVVFLASLTLKYMNQQEITKEKLIDSKIRGGKDNEISEIAESALKIEITPNLRAVGHKKENFSIILPISEKQSKILKNQKQENRNKIILLTIPYVIGAAIIFGALVQNRFSFANVKTWVEISCILLVFIIASVGIFMTLKKLKNNEINQEYNTTLKFGSPNPFKPFRADKVISVTKEHETDKEENDPVSWFIRVLREVGDKFCDIMDKRFQVVEGNFNGNVNKFLEDTKNNIKDLLDNLEEDIKKNVGGVKNEASREITKCLRDIGRIIDALCKEVGGGVRGKLGEVNVKKLVELVNAVTDVANTIEDKVARFRPGKFWGISTGFFAKERDPKVVRSYSYSSTSQYNDDSDDRFHDAHSCATIAELHKPLEKLEKSLTSKQKQPNELDSGCDTSCDSEGSANDHLSAQLAEERKVKEENKFLKSKEKTEKLKRENSKLKEGFSKQKETDEWKKEINGKASEFLHHILKSTKLEIKDGLGEKIGEMALLNVDNKIKIYWKDGLQTICYINKHGDIQVEPGTEMNFVDTNIDAAFRVACSG
ncbi:MAG: hypothetical protein PV345_04725 [Wolbachia sp.]|nr:hypothetical protein [Wolbachia sp.]